MQCGRCDKEGTILLSTFMLRRCKDGCGGQPELREGARGGIEVPPGVVATTYSSTSSNLTRGPPIGGVESCEKLASACNSALDGTFGKQIES